MTDDKSCRHTVRADEEFVDELMETYPAAQSAAEAWRMAAQDGLTYQKAVENDLQTYITKSVEDELEERGLE